MREYKEWTIEEEKVLRDMFIDGKSDYKIAEQLGRTVAGIKSRRTALGLFQRKIKHWTEEEEKKLEVLFRKGKTDDKIAEELGRTKASISSRKSMLGLANRTMKRRTKNGNGLEVEIEPLKRGQDYVLKTIGTGIFNSQEKSKEIATYQGDTEDLLIFKRNNYKETYTKVDVALGEVSIREATKTDYQTLQN